MNQLLDGIEIGNESADKAIIWLHGLGADGHDFEPIVPELDLPANHNIRFIFPHAPQRPVTINSGMNMPAWYDVASMSFTDSEDEVGIRQSAIQITQLVEREKERGVDPGNIVLAGFSQGGAIALHTALRYPETLAGVIVLSSYLPLRDLFIEEAHAANLATPILMCHGIMDPVIPVNLGADSSHYLQQQGYPVEWHTYPMQHSVCAEEIRDISQWLQQHLLG